MNGICHLCQRKRELLLSHIIPKFVWRWLKNTSSGSIREGQNPNLRIQDGPKEYILCSDCEQLIGVWEKTFSEKIFIPYHESSPTTFTRYSYKTWCMKFAVSVSWRALIYFDLQGQLADIDSEQQEAVHDAHTVWREFLLGHRSHPDQYEQHLLPLDAIKNHTVPELSPFINRYIFRSVAADVLVSDISVAVYTKMGRLALFGFVQMPNRTRKYWKGMKLHVRKGFVGSKKYKLPESIHDYLNEKSNRGAQLLANLSPNQKAKIAKVLKGKPGEIGNSEAFRAMQHDVKLFGDMAFEITKPAQDEG